MWDSCVSCLHKLDQVSRASFSYDFLGRRTWVVCHGLYRISNKTCRLQAFSTTPETCRCITLRRSIRHCKLIVISDGEALLVDVYANNSRLSLMPSSSGRRKLLLIYYKNYNKLFLCISKSMHIIRKTFQHEVTNAITNLDWVWRACYEINYTQAAMEDLSVPSNTSVITWLPGCYRLSFLKGVFSQTQVVRSFKQTIGSRQLFHV